MKINKYLGLIKQKSKGFTLVEMLVVMVVFSVVGSIATAILVTSLRTSSKTTILTNVKQSGNFAIEQTTKILREARLLRAPFPCGTVSAPTYSSSVSVVTVDNLPIVLSCHNCASDTGVCTNLNNDPSTISSNSASLLDTNGLNLLTCQFTCTQQSISDYPVVSMNFSMTNRTSSSFSENAASSSAISFFTSVSLRNINR